MLVLRPRQPQARDVRLATHTAVARTTNHLARNVHSLPKLREGSKPVNIRCRYSVDTSHQFFGCSDPGFGYAVPPNPDTSTLSSLLKSPALASDIYI